MSVTVLTTPKLWFHRADLTGDFSQVALDDGVDLVPCTAFGDTGIRRKAGLFGCALAAEGFWNGATNRADQELAADVGVAGRPVSIATLTGADAEVAYTFQAIYGEYVALGTIGEMYRFSVKAEGSEGIRLTRGLVLHPQTARTSSGTGTINNFGALAATQSMDAALHVLAVSGTNPTLDVILQWNNGAGFSSPSTGITFAQKTAIGSAWGTVAGALALATHWRVSYTIGGTDTPTFTFVVVAGYRTNQN